jgi:hypothetical protein
MIKLIGKYAQFIYTLIIPLTCSWIGRKRGLEVDCNFLNKLCLSGFELKTSISDTIINYYYAPSSSP